VYINFEFVDGTRGAHVSISGVSGIATKTSFALFLLHSILNSGVLAGEVHNTKMLVFSVKGEDLLFLDYANQRLTPEQRKRYDELGLPAAPFQNVRVFAPPRPGDTAGTPDVSARDKAVSPFYERAQYTMLIGQVVRIAGAKLVVADSNWPPPPREWPVHAGQFADTRAVSDRVWCKHLAVEQARVPCNDRRHSRFGGLDGVTSGWDQHALQFRIPVRRCRLRAPVPVPDHHP
jgi:hypothetical protein